MSYQSVVYAELESFTVEHRSPTFPTVLDAKLYATIDAVAALDSGVPVAGVRVVEVEGEADYPSLGAYDAAIKSNTATARGEWIENGGAI